MGGVQDQIKESRARSVCLQLCHASRFRSTNDCSLALLVAHGYSLLALTLSLLCVPLSRVQPKTTCVHRTHIHTHHHTHPLPSIDALVAHPS
ncbi:MAG: hypothetical protein BYD32DRAFT_445057 [Podila humilis]|nr:MAG: hypothetical protein BYD32DRAFT_445057 [Podila humilis]